MKIDLENDTFTLSLGADDVTGPVVIDNQYANGDSEKTTINLQTIPRGATCDFTVTLSAKTMIKFAKQARWWNAVANKAKR